MADFQMPDMSPYLNAMMQYWGPMMESGLERMEALPEREAIAFDEYVRGKRLDRQRSEEDILDQQLRRKYAKRDYSKDVLSAAPKSRHSEAMSATRAAADAESMMKGRRMQDTLRAKDVLDAIPRISTGGIGGTEAWRNMPAAGAFSGVQFQPNPWIEVYKAGAGPAAAASQTEAGKNVRQRREYEAEGVPQSTTRSSLY